MHLAMKYEHLKKVDLASAMNLRSDLHDLCERKAEICFYIREEMETNLTVQVKDVSSRW
jgi:hypothetical protein